jgi:hypothetical protein
MASPTRQQDAASPWAFVAFEAENAAAVWEAFEREPIHATAFAPIEDAPFEAMEGLVAEEQTAPHDPVTVPMASAPDDKSRHYDKLHFEERLRELERSHEAAMSELERKFTVELLGNLAAQIESQASKLADEIGGRLTRILAPVLMDHARKASLAALTRDLQRILLSGEVNKIILSGPQELVAQIQSELGEHASRLQIEGTAAVDVTVRIDSGVLATKLCAWTSVLKDVVA